MQMSLKNNIKNNEHQEITHKTFKDENNEKDVSVEVSGEDISSIEAAG